MTFPTLTAIELLDGYRTKAFSPVEVTSELLDLAERLNPTLNAFYAIDRDGALRAARESEKRWSRGAPCGPLDGIPSSVKDALPSKGFPSYRGSAAHRAEDSAWTDDAPVIARMREAGAIFLGKTTMPDFGILASGTSSKHGVTTNPWDTTKTPGGSSAGAAASIAAGINPIAVGTDIVGSIRLPASFCGLFGHKPSQGRVPYYFPNSPSLVAGPLARSVSDAALLMNVIAHPDNRDFTALPYDETDYIQELVEKPRGQIRIGYLEALGFGLQIDPEVSSLTRHRLDALVTQGIRVEPVEVTFSRSDLMLAERFYKVRCRAELKSMPSDRQRLADTIWAWSTEVEDLSASEFYNIFNEMQKLRERAANLISRFDFLALPTVHIPAFDASVSAPNLACPFEPFAYCFLFNLTEQPACSIPSGQTEKGLPVGLQIVGRRYDDKGVFRLAALLERAFPFTPDLISIINKQTKAVQP